MEDYLEKSKIESHLKIADKYIINEEYEKADGIRRESEDTFLQGIKILLDMQNKSEVDIIPAINASMRLFSCFENV